VQKESAGHRGRPIKKSPGWHAPGLINATRTICKPMRSEMVNALHRPDGLPALYHAQ
jgi:hypothetical protein